MGFEITLLILIIAGACCFFAGLFLALRMGKRKKAMIHSCLDSFRSMGELLVFKVISKDVVTVEEKAFEGMMGRLLPDWIFSKRKIIMIFEFSMNFSYDLRDPIFTINSSGDGTVDITMPVPSCDVALKDLFFYDEQKSRFLPLLLPEIINGPLGRSFNVEEKNRLFAESMEMVQQKAHDLLEKYQEDVRTSAKHTLEGIARSFGASVVNIVFSEKEAKIEARLNGEAA